MTTKPTHLSLFAIDKANRHPIANAPFYAEVVAPIVVTTPEIDPDDRFDESIDAQLGKIDATCAGDKTCRSAYQGDHPKGSVAPADARYPRLAHGQRAQRAAFDRRGDSFRTARRAADR